MISNAILYNEELASKCIYGSDFVKDLLGIKHSYPNVYSVEHNENISYRKLEGFRRLAQARNYYQNNPIQFIKDFFKIQLVDSQAYLMMEAWNKPQVMILASRAYGKSFWMVLFIMAKQMLSSDPWSCYIASGSSQQSATTFKKLEDIANDRISSLINSSGSIFKAEVEISNAAGDGFSHNPSGFEYKLHNGAFTKTLNSNVDRNRGARSLCVCFDECGFLSADLIQVYQAFCAVDTGFVTGVNDDGSAFDNVRLATLPKPLPTQLIYVSSASSVDTEFYRMYREFSKKMILGDPNYFVACIDCDLVMSPTIDGKRTRAALTQEKIDAALSTNNEKARREYYCEFTTDAGANAIIRRGDIARNEETRKPILYNDNGKRKIVISYDPARSRDDSCILISEIYDSINSNGKIEKKMRILNAIKLIDLEKKNKTPMRTPEQIAYLKQLILDYNQGGDENYSNIMGVFIDAGSGGAGVNIADYLMEDWVDEKGETHKGLIDKEYSGDYVKKFPNAVNKIHLMSPTQYKSEMYEAMIELISQDKISFTSSYDSKGYLTVIEKDSKKVDELTQKIINNNKNKNLSEEKLQSLIDKEVDKIDELSTKTVKLDWQEEIALVTIDAMKEQLVNMVRIKRESGKDSFELAPEKKNRMHDDLAYVCCMSSYALQEERRKYLKQKPKKKYSTSLADKLLAHAKTSSMKIGMFDD